MYLFQAIRHLLRNRNLYCHLICVCVCVKKKQILNEIHILSGLNQREKREKWETNKSIFIAYGVYFDASEQCSIFILLCDFSGSIKFQHVFDTCSDIVSAEIKWFDFWFVVCYFLLRVIFKKYLIQFQCYVSRSIGEISHWNFRVSNFNQKTKNDSTQQYRICAHTKNQKDRTTAKKKKKNWATKKDKRKEKKAFLFTYNKQQKSKQNQWIWRERNKWMHRLKTSSLTLYYKYVYSSNNVKWKQQQN